MMGNKYRRLAEGQKQRHRNKKEWQKPKSESNKALEERSRIVECRLLHKIIIKKIFLSLRLLLKLQMKNQQMQYQKKR